MSLEKKPVSTSMGPLSTPDPDIVEFMPVLLSDCDCAQVESAKLWSNSASALLLDVDVRALVPVPDVNPGEKRDKDCQVCCCELELVGICDD